MPPATMLIYSKEEGCAPNWDVASSSLLKPTLYLAAVCFVPSRFDALVVVASLVEVVMSNIPSMHSSEC